jgi:hypothetical protein
MFFLPRFSLAQVAAFAVAAEPMDAENNADPKL